MGEEELEPGLEGFSDSGSDFHEIPLPPLPGGVCKSLVRASPHFSVKKPQVGDEVLIHYTAWRAAGRAEFSTSRGRSEPIKFRLGKGEVMNGWDIGVATMRLGEVAEFACSPAYNEGGQGLVSGTIQPTGAVIFEIELVEWITFCDLFEDGTVLKKVLRRPDDRRKPIIGQECLMNYRLSLVEGGAALQERDHFTYTIGSPTAEGACGGMSSSVLDRALLSMKRGERAVLQGEKTALFTAACALPPAVAPGAQVCCELELEEFIETSDISFDKDGTVIKRSLRSRDAWVKCDDAGRCSLRVISVRDGETEHTRGETLQFMVGNGEVCDALECATASMREHEVAEVTCSDAGMCDRERFGVVGSRDLAFHLEVLAYEPGLGESSEIKGTRLARKDEERFVFLESRKNVGVDLFKAGRYKLAAHRFGKAHELLGYIDDYRGLKGSEAMKSNVVELKKTCLLNRALCTLRCSNYRSALKSCDSILEDEPHNVKALFRRAQAHLALGDCIEAVKDVRTAQEVEPQNAELRRLLNQIKASQKEEDTHTRHLYEKMCNGLGHLPHPLDVD